MDLTYFINMLGLLSLIVVVLNIVLIVFLSKKIDNFKLIDKSIINPIIVIIIVFSLILTANPTNVDARFDFCLVAAIIEFLVHCFYQMKKYEGTIGFFVAFVQNNLVLMTALVVNLCGMVVSVLLEG